MSHDIDTVLGWRGRRVRDREGEELGKLGDVYLDREDDRPAWAGIRTGLFGRRETIVPLQGVSETEDGDLRLPYDAALVRDAPNVDPDVAPSEEEERLLREHFSAQHETVRHEEELQVVDREPAKPTERVRLRKVQVTEEEPVTFERRREVVQLEHEPPPEGRIERVEDAGEA
ncbi:MAG: PRC-barrel domain-containing protein [Solirubrobacterales bacterium]|nr:PRC-barrel domain-containing protein [Solirubrobacterales bacterium]